MYSESRLSKNIKITIYKTKMLPIVLHEWDIWCLLLSENHRLIVLENGGTHERGSNRNLRKLRNKEFNNY
jgi:hypothetical protein